MADPKPNRDVVVTREFAAPRELVFDAWTMPELMKQWFGPRGFTLSVSAMEFRVGGAYRSCFHGPNGEEYPFGGVYREIVPPERLVYTTTFPDGAEMITTLVLTEHDGKTQLTVRQAIPDSIAADDPRLRGAPQGWRETIDRLGEYVTAHL